MKLLSKKEFNRIKGLLTMKDISFAEIGRRPEFVCTGEYVRQAIKGMFNSELAEGIRAYVAEITSEEETS